ncbi:MAG: nucleotidyltransferase domain-containing protein [Mariprofundales bacterium]
MATTLLPMQHQWDKEPNIGEPSARSSLQQRIADLLPQFPNIELAILFGSAASNRLRPGSDIDIATAAATPLKITQIIAISTALQHLLRRGIDCIDLNAVSGTILQQALCTGIIIKKTPARLAALMKKMWYNQADMMPHTRRIMEAHCQRFLYDNAV